MAKYIKILVIIFIISLLFSTADANNLIHINPSGYVNDTFGNYVSDANITLTGYYNVVGYCRIGHNNFPRETTTNNDGYWNIPNVSILDPTGGSSCKLILTVEENKYETFEEEVMIDFTITDYEWNVTLEALEVRIPETTTPIITPSEPNVLDNLECSATLTDSQEINLIAEYVWYRNGDEIVSGQTQVVRNTNTIISTLSHTNTYGEDEIICEVTPHNSYFYGDSRNSSTVLVNKIESEVELTITPSSPVDYGTQTTAICTTTNPEENAILWRNGEDVTATENGIAVILEAGIHNYVCSVSETQNYTSAEESQGYIVNERDPTDPDNPLVFLTINGEEEDFEGTYPIETIATGWKNTNEISDGELHLYLNDDPVDTNADSVEDVRTLDVGTHEYRLVFTNSNNFQDAEIVRTVTIGESDEKPTIILSKPKDNISVNESSLSFEAEFIDSYGLKNATLHVWNSTGDLIFEVTENIVGNQVELSIPIIFDYQDVFEWNYLACNELDNCAFASENWTVTYDEEAPEIILFLPANETSTRENSIEFKFKAIDNFTEVMDCELFVNDKLMYLGNVENNEKVTWEIYLDIGKQEWYVTCNDDANNLGISEKWNFNIVERPTPPPPRAPKPVTVIVSMELNRTQINMNSDEVKTVEIYIENQGDQYLADIELLLNGLDDENYEFSNRYLSLSSKTSDTSELILYPEYTKTGNYEIEIKLKTATVSISENLEIFITNIFEDDAILICENAISYINELEAEEFNTSELMNQYSSAENYMNTNRFERAIDVCELILEFEPEEEEEVEEPILPTPTGITGLFIAVGEFTWDNVSYISLLLVVIILIYLGRGGIIKFFKNLKKPPETPPIVGKTGSRNYAFGNAKREKIYEIEW